MLLIDSPAPKSFQITFKRLGLPNALEGVATALLDKFIDSRNHFRLSRHPLLILLPCHFRKGNRHKSFNDFLTTFPSVNCFIPRRSFSAFAFEDNRYSVSANEL